MEGQQKLESSQFSRRIGALLNHGSKALSNREMILEPCVGLPVCSDSCNVVANMLSEIVQVSAFEEPEELLAALRGSNDAFWNEIPNRWIFRGYADSDWELLPTALRKDSRLTHHPERAPGPYATMEHQLDVESAQVLKFADIANRQGLAIPGGWNTARRLLSTPGSSGKTFPPLELRDLFALAQHHGVPTRLLDWSRKPLDAVYFAAQGAAQMMNAKKLRESQLLEIWVIG